MKKLYSGVYQNTKVLVTGHTGFKGTWLVSWLNLLGAKVYGIALSPETTPNHFDLLSPDCNSKILDINDANLLDQTIKDIQPTIIFHLAAQALVRKSYTNPLETLQTNIMGTANLLNSCRDLQSLEAVVVVTSDKCYENKEWIWGYREDEAMGGHDPYSASKGATELITSSFRQSYFHSENSPLISTARAGNVVGGGDWSEDRLIPDLVKNANQSKATLIRNPLATRPWQHVLEPLSGYLQLGEKLLQKKKEFAQAYNFGPHPENTQTVETIVKVAHSYWSKVTTCSDSSTQPHEAQLLSLDSSKAKQQLKWHTVWDLDQTFEKTIQWYKNYYESKSIHTKDQIHQYVSDATKKKLSWTQNYE
ncbi:MAG: CDP-glucose 4,6-dehydratase [Candidatus Cloacimonetes bacterium]|nr:CDP-glucose 4,6-dehydratase [Candidatus Cloacimonadota bacterium]